jgi:hypothetical protein
MMLVLVYAGSTAYRLPNVDRLVTGSFYTVNPAYVFHHGHPLIVTVQVIDRESDANLLTTANVVRQSIVPAEAALNMPASVIAPVDTPATKDA